MRSYGQFCPVAKAAELFCERWNALIIRDLAGGPRRFSELQKGVPLMSPSLLSQRLKQLAVEDVLERRPDQGNGFVYALTEAGQEFVPLVSALGVWGQRWTRRELQEHEIDLGLLVWSIESSARAGCFGARRCLIRLELSDQPEAKRFWWFMNEDGQCNLCVDDPGGGVDLFLASTLPMPSGLSVATLNWRCLESGRLEALGEKWARDRLGDWLNLSPLTRIVSRLPFTT